MGIKSVALRLLVLAPLALSVPTPKTSPARLDLPLQRRGLSIRDMSGNDRLAAITKSQRRFKRKYGLTEELDDALVKRGVDVPMGGSEATNYVEVVIGTPPISYSVLLDTGSSDLVLATKAVTDLCGQGCDSTGHRYNPSQSSTSKNYSVPVFLQYGIGSANGTLYSDVMSFAGFTATQNLTAAAVADDYVSTPDETGLIGMAWQSLSETNSMPFVQGLFENDLLAEPLFSMAVANTQQDDAETPVSGGVLTIGGTNPSYFSGNISYVPLVDNGSYWNIPLDSVSLNGTSLGLNFSAATIDSGTNCLFLPQFAADIIYDAIPGSSVLDAVNGLYSYPCSTPIELAFTFGGTTYHVNPTTFNLGPVESSKTSCYGAVLSGGNSTDANATWIMGAPFLESVYSVFRFSPPSVGFATLVDPGGLLEDGAIPLSNGTAFAEPCHTSCEVNKSLIDAKLALSMVGLALSLASYGMVMLRRHRYRKFLRQQEAQKAEASEEPSPDSEEKGKTESVDEK